MARMELFLGEGYPLNGEQPHRDHQKAYPCAEAHYTTYYEDRPTHLCTALHFTPSP